MNDNTPENIEITEADFMMAAVLPRTNSLMDMLEQSFEMKCDLMMGGGGLPRIEAAYEGERITFSYLPVGNSDTDRFILLVSADAYTVPADEDGMGMVFECEGFNSGSTFGYAIYNPTDKVIALRATIPELGGMPDEEWYRHWLGLFLGSLWDLQEMINEPEDSE